MIWLSCSMSVENVHPLDSGFFRLKFRRDRRPGMSIENPLIFYSRRMWDLLYGHARILALAWKLDRICRGIKTDPLSRDYMDVALTPVTDEDKVSLEMFSNADPAKAAAKKVHATAAAPGAQS